MEETYNDDIRSQLRARLKKEIIQNNIYGVDIEEGAIEIARLRFWLSIVIDLDKPEALPNFDYKFMQGNSLLESYQFDVESENQNAKKKSVSIDLSGICKEERAENVNNNGVAIQFEEGNKEREDLMGLLRKYYGETDHEKKKALRGKIEKQVRVLLNAKCSQSYIKYINAMPLICDKFFLWHLWFKDVFDRGGFDIVIGNPPYFKYEGSYKGEIEQLRSIEYLKFAFGGKLNAYKLFLSLAIKHLARKDGIVSLIFQNSFMGDIQAAALREEIIMHNQILVIDSFPERDDKKKRVFESAKMSVCILVMKIANTAQPFKVNIWDDKDKSSGIQTIFSKSEIEIIDSDAYTIPRMRNSQKEIVIKLKAIPVFSLKCYEGELNMTNHKKYFTQNRSYPKVLKGASIQRYYITEQMSQGKIDYLDEYSYLSENQGDKVMHHNCERIAMQGMTGANAKVRIVMTIVPQGYYLANSCNYIIPNNAFPARFLLGVFNSKIINWFFKIFSTNSNVNGYEIEQLPIPTASPTQQQEIITIVDKILSIKNANPATDTTKYERQIDALVYELYGITSYDELLEIEGNEQKALEMQALISSHINKSK